MFAFFGCGQIAEKEIKEGKIPDLIFDNNPELEGSLFYGVPVSKVDPHKLASVDRLLICSSSIRDIQEQCAALDFSLDRIEVSVHLGEIARAFRLEQYRFSGYVSSGLPSTTESLKGGGIFRVTEDDYGSASIEKIFEANTHGCIRVGDELVFSAQGHGIVHIDTRKNEVTKTVSIDSGLRPHGVRWDGEFYFVVCALDDSVRQYASDGSLVEVFRVSDKLARYGTPQHHCNDLFVTDQSIYVSMFSVTGHWKRGCFDGGIVEFCRETGEKSVLINTLKMPHSVELQAETLMILESFTGSVLGHDFESLGALNGFARGLAVGSDFLIVGESKNRNVTRMPRGNSFASIDTRVTIIDPSIGISKSIQLPNTISEIHSVVV